MLNEDEAEAALCPKRQGIMATASSAENKCFMEKGLVWFSQNSATSKEMRCLQRKRPTICWINRVGLSSLVAYVRPHLTSHRPPIPPPVGWLCPKRRPR